MTWDGIKGETWTPEHLRACEARLVATWPRERRVEYYAKVKAARGEDGLRALREAVNEAWRQRNEGADVRPRAAEARRDERDRA